MNMATQIKGLKVDRIADFCNTKTKYVHRWVKDISMWISTISDYAEVTLVDRNIVDLGSLANGLRLFDGSFDFIAVGSTLKTLVRVVMSQDSSRAIDLSNEVAVFSTSVCKSTLWLGKLDVINLGPLVSPLNIAKCSLTIYSMGIGIFNTGEEVYNGRSQSSREEIDNLRQKILYYTLVRNVTVIALSVLTLLKEFAICPIVPVVMLSLSTLTLVTTTGEFISRSEMLSMSKYS